jgi:hypothetical protein
MEEVTMYVNMRMGAQHVDALAAPLSTFRVFFEDEFAPNLKAMFQSDVG